MLVKVIVGSVIGDEKIAETGDTIELKDSEAKELIALKLVEAVEKPKAKPGPKPKKVKPEPEPEKETEK